MARHPQDELFERDGTSRDPLGLGQLGIKLDPSSITMPEDANIAAPVTPARAKTVSTGKTAPAAKTEAAGLIDPSEVQDHIRSHLYEYASGVYTHALQTAVDQKQNVTRSDDEQKKTADYLEHVRTQAIDALLANQAFDNDAAKATARKALDAKFNTLATALAGEESLKDSDTALTDRIANALETAGIDFDLTPNEEDQAFIDEATAEEKRLRDALHLRAEAAKHAPESGVSSIAKAANNAYNKPVALINEASIKRMDGALETFYNDARAKGLIKLSANDFKGQLLLTQILAENEVLEPRIVNKLVYGSIGAFSGISSVAVDTIKAGYQAYKNSPDSPDDMSMSDWLQHQLKTGGEVLKKAAEQAGDTTEKQIVEQLTMVGKRDFLRAMQDTNEMFTKGARYHNTRMGGLNSSESLTAKLKELKENHPNIYAKITDENGKITKGALADALDPQMAAFANALTGGGFSRGQTNEGQYPISQTMFQNNQTIASALWTDYPIKNAAKFKDRGLMVTQYSHHTRTVGPEKAVPTDGTDVTEAGTPPNLPSSASLNIGISGRFGG